MELRTCIAILFSFQRRPMRDERFVRDAQDWLSRLVAILVRVGNWQDHMFLLNHILRFCHTSKFYFIFMKLLTGTETFPFIASDVQQELGCGLQICFRLQSPLI